MYEDYEHAKEVKYGRTMKTWLTFIRKMKVNISMDTSHGGFSLTCILPESISNYFTISPM